MTAAMWWFIVIVASIGIAMVAVPTRDEVARWRHQRSEQARIEWAIDIARYLPEYLTPNLALAITMALDELGVARAAAAPRRAGWQADELARAQQRGRF